MRTIIYSCVVLLFISCGSTPNEMLQIAVENGHVEAMREAIDKGASINEVMAYDQPILCELITECNIEGIELVLKKGANPNIECDGEPALMLALDCEYLPLMEMLIKAGANVNQVDEFGITTLAWSINNSQIETFKYLLQNGASMEIRDSSGFHPVVYATNLEVLKVLEELNFPTEVVSSDNTTFLMDAVDMGSYEIVEYLIAEKKVDINVKNDENLTAYDFLQPKDTIMKILLDQYY